jgi:hypothetical protein
MHKFIYANCDTVVYFDLYTFNHSHVFPYFHTQWHRHIVSLILSNNIPNTFFYGQSIVFPDRVDHNFDYMDANHDHVGYSHDVGHLYYYPISYTDTLTDPFSNKHTIGNPVNYHNSNSVTDMFTFRHSEHHSFHDSYPHADVHSLWYTNILTLVHAICVCHTNTFVDKYDDSNPHPIDDAVSNCNGHPHNNTNVISVLHTIVDTYVVCIINSNGIPHIVTNCNSDHLTYFHEVNNAVYVSLMHCNTHTNNFHHSHAFFIKDDVPVKQPHRDAHTQPLIISVNVDNIFPHVQSHNFSNCHNNVFPNIHSNGHTFLHDHIISHSHGIDHIHWHPFTHLNKHAHLLTLKFADAQSFH